jgi:transcriptional regulator with XRE-family HTH domain
MRELATAADVSISYVSRLENDISWKPSIENASKLARALGCSLDDLFCATESNQCRVPNDVSTLVATPEGVRYVRAVKTYLQSSQSMKDVRALLRALGTSL